MHIPNLSSSIPQSKQNTCCLDKPIWCAGIAVASPEVICVALVAKRVQARIAHGNLLGSSRHAVTVVGVSEARPLVKTGLVYDACNVTNLNIVLPVSPFKEYFPLSDTEALVELSEVGFCLHVAPGETHASKTVFFRTIEHTDSLHEREDTGARQVGAVGELHGF